jgi:flagellar hook assembly protein FlgD
LIKVANYPVSVSDLVQKPISNITVYPNPFNPTTTIAFNTLATQEVELSLYNLKGQKVRTLYQGILNGGEHKLIWDGKDNNGRTVSSGIYFAKIQAGKYTQIRKMMLIK